MAKSDVRSMGVVLLEILTGRRAFDRRRPRGAQKLVDWARRHPVGTRWFSRIIDPRLAGVYSFEAAQDVAVLAGGCLAERAGERPTMVEVVRGLRRAMQHAEMDGPPEPPEEASPPASPGHTGSASAAPVQSSRRRMLLLAKLAASANGAAARRLALMKARTPA